MIPFVAYQCDRKNSLSVEKINSIFECSNSHGEFCVSRFVEDGVNFSINSDDPLICQTRVDIEQGVAFDQIGLSPAELTRAVSCF